MHAKRRWGVVAMRQGAIWVWRSWVMVMVWSASRVSGRLWSMVRHWWALIPIRISTLITLYILIICHPPNLPPTIRIDLLTTMFPLHRGMMRRRVCTMAWSLSAKTLIATQHLHHFQTKLSMVMSTLCILKMGLYVGIHWQADFKQIL